MKRVKEVLVVTMTKNLVVEVVVLGKAVLLGKGSVVAVAVSVAVVAETRVRMRMRMRMKDHQQGGL